MSLEMFIPPEVSRLEQSAIRKLRALPEARALLKFCRFDSKE